MKAKAHGLQKQLAGTEGREAMGVALAIAAVGLAIWPAGAQSYSSGPQPVLLSDYADIAPAGASVGRNYVWGLRITCPPNTEPVGVACWIGDVTDATMTTSGGLGPEAYCLWRFGPFASGMGRVGKMTATCGSSMSAQRRR